VRNITAKDYCQGSSQGIVVVANKPDLIEKRGYAMPARFAAILRTDDMRRTVHANRAASEWAVDQQHFDIDWSAKFQRLRIEKIDATGAYVRRVEGVLQTIALSSDSLHA
jgi:hypothetical protein